MTKAILVSSASSLHTTTSVLTESTRQALAAVPESRGSRVVLLEPVALAPTLPADFVDIDHLVEQEEKDHSTHEAIAAGRQAIAEHYYDSEPRRLAWYRLQKGWSQKQLASRLGTSQSYVARLEAGNIDPQLSTLQRLAGVFEIAPADVLDALLAGVKAS
jgi:DNA-binding XRE family transcriptional regulator